MTNAARITYYWAHRTPEQLLSTKKREKAREVKRVAKIEKDKEDMQRRQSRLVMRSLSRECVDLHKIQKRARERGLDFDLTSCDIEIPEFCPILGLRLSFSSDCQSPNAPSLDRIDNAKGYVKGNVQVISMRANVLKRDAQLAELVALGKWAGKF